MLRKLFIPLLSAAALVASGAGFANESEFSKKERAIISISAFTANGDIPKLKTSLVNGLEAGLTVNEIKEIQTQLYAYAGFPRSLNGLTAFMQVLEERKANGITDEVGKESKPLPTDKTSLEFGTENQTKLIGQEVKGGLFDFAPQADEYLKAHLFGDIFERDVLTWREREISTIAALASIEGVNSQLKAHYMISQNNGVTVPELHAFVEILKSDVSEDIAKNAQTSLDEILAK
ncbi:MAG: carboxymuconolactone decarboxylase family protein [Vibrio sp.]